MRKDFGFSLMEIMVAIFIISIISAAGSTIVLRSVNGKAFLETATERVDRFAGLHSRIRDDLAQWVPRAAESRPVIDPKVEFLGGGVGDSTMLFAFVRDGWTNPGLTEARSGLLSVRYSFDRGQLTRVVQTMADPLYNAEGIEEVLLEDVRDVRVEFRQGDQWLPQWQSVDGSGGGAPPAVRFFFQTESGESFTWLFLTPAGAMT